MAKGVGKPCKQCGTVHHGYADICWSCERDNKDASTPPIICPYCNKEKSKRELRNTRYHHDCSWAVSAISGKATAQVVKAIRRGDIEPITPDTICVDCGKPARDYDHRHYSKPLDVVPVCRACNQKRGPALDLHEFYISAQAV